MIRKFANLLLGCYHIPGRWRRRADGRVEYDCSRCFAVVESAIVLDLPPPRRTQEAKEPAETGLEKLVRVDWLRELGVSAE